MRESGGIGWFHGIAVMILASYQECLLGRKTYLVVWDLFLCLWRVGVRDCLCV